MSHQPLVSIITPTYNHERFIGQCIESVLAQTYPHWEQIIIDDGSTDKTGEVVAQYRDERIKYVRQEHVGIWRLGETYNKALNHSQGKFIAILEGDDFWPPYKLKSQMPVFLKQEVIFTWGKVAMTNSMGKVVAINPKSLKWVRNSSKQEMLRKLLLRVYMPSCTVICRKESLVSMGGFKQPAYAPFVDYPTWLELSLLGEFPAIDEIMGYWRWHKESVTTVMAMTVVEAANKCSQDFFEQLPQELKRFIGISREELAAAHQENIAGVFIQLGRIALLNGKWEDSRQNFIKALHIGSCFRKMVALLGLTCSYFKIDLEWAAKAIGRFYMK